MRTRKQEREANLIFRFVECGMMFTGDCIFEEGDLVVMVESKSVKVEFLTDNYKPTEYDE